MNKQQLIHGLRQIRRTLDGSQPKDPAGAVMALDYLVKTLETKAPLDAELERERRETRRLWVKHFAEHVQRSTRYKDSQRESEEEAMKPGRKAFHRQMYAGWALSDRKLRRFHVTRANDFARAIING